MRRTIVTINTEPMTTGPIGSWKGTDDLFEICCPRQMNVHVAYTHRHTDAESMHNATDRPMDVYSPVSAMELPADDVNACVCAWFNPWFNCAWFNPWFNPWFNA